MIDMIDRGDPAEEYMNGLADFERAAQAHPIEKHEEAMNDDDKPNRRSATIPIVLVCAVVVLALGIWRLFGGDAQ